MGKACHLWEQERRWFGTDGERQRRLQQRQAPGDAEQEAGAALGAVRGVVERREHRRVPVHGDAHHGQHAAGHGEHGERGQRATQPGVAVPRQQRRRHQHRRRQQIAQHQAHHESGNNYIGDLLNLMKSGQRLMQEMAQRKI